MVTIFDLFSICWCGEQIPHNENYIYEKIAALNWYQGSKEFQKNILLALAFLQKETEYKLCGIFPLRLTFFVSILRLSYSTYAVLHEFTANN
ncbi:odorant receptor 43a-like [Chrysoperla carnea]|uniref:odorant receptor 43a-like n=1 Tax=Chrysoperla carnea TaxID=189513 RepID=UPI001D0697F6|nr:odorant receptor 43a-like [Chrysoperla carnea]